jgi:uncharacterized membrane protein
MEHQVTTTADAAPADIWRLYMDVERWPEMSKSTREVRRLDRGPFQVGSEAMVRQPGLPRTRWRVTELEPGHSFTWETVNTGLTTVGWHTVEASGPGSLITIGIRLRGPLAGVTEALVGRRAQRSITMEMEGFRRTAELEKRQGAE